MNVVNLTKRLLNFNKYIMKILVTQPIFLPNEDKLQRNINSITSFKYILKKYLLLDIKIDIKIGGWAQSDKLWDTFITKLEGLNYDISYTRFDRNYGKSYIINKLSENIHEYDYMLSLDSDIIFIDNNPIKRLIKLSERISNYSNKSFGFLSLNQEEGNCHLTDILDKSFKWMREEVKWNDKASGIAGGCFFTSSDNWIEIGGYRKGLKNYDSDDYYFLIDTFNNNRTYGMVESISVIHPKDNDKKYSEWKLDSATNKKSICFFSSYSNKDYIDNYIKFYLEFLKNYFDDVLFVTNKREINSRDSQFLKKINVTIKRVKNEGMDFGMWYKCFNDDKIDIFNYNKIGLVNDSCILFSHERFNKLMKWVDNNNLEYSSITESNEIDYHLQSYFLILKDQSIKLTYDYFKEHGILNTREDIIKTYEVGLTQYLKSNNIKVGSFIKGNTDTNPTILNFDINTKIPIIKKKLLTNKFNESEISFLKSCNFNFKHNWIDTLKEITKKDTTSIEYLIEDL